MYGAYDDIQLFMRVYIGANSHKCMMLCSYFLLSADSPTYGSGRVNSAKDSGPCPSVQNLRRYREDPRGPVRKDETQEENVTANDSLH